MLPDTETYVLKPKKFSVVFHGDSFFLRASFWCEELGTALESLNGMKDLSGRPLFGLL